MQDIKVVGLPLSVRVTVLTLSVPHLFLSVSLLHSRLSVGALASAGDCRRSVPLADAIFAAFNDL
jgi:hypothetical protein